MQLEIDKLISLGAISVCSPVTDQYISKIFLAPKPNGQKRFILNLKSFNKYVIKSHFKMEDHRTAAKLIMEGAFLATIDLKESYLLVPVAHNYRKFLRFNFKSSNLKQFTYEFNGMPYGLSVAPRIFTKIMKEVVKYLRNLGFISVIYLDDILCIGSNYDNCLKNVQTTLRVLECLGFVVNYEKSCIEPKQKCKFLGFIFNTIDMCISLPMDKRNSIAQLVDKYLQLPNCTIREFAQFIGTLTAACPAVKYGWLYTKLFERQKFLALRNSHDYEAKIKLSTVILPDLLWWKCNIYRTDHYMRNQNFDLEIFSDASRTGWGIFCNSQRTNGLWKDSEKIYHINYLELLAAFFGLKCFAKTKTNCAILLRIDNTTAVSYINRFGGIQYPHLNKLTRLIWQWCEKRNLWLFASYINTKDNIEADEESRRQNQDIEFELNRNFFKKIVKRFGHPQIDLFASRTNTKCKSYISWKPDPEAMNVDAFTINWKPFFFYAFPPFPIVLKCLEKIISDNARGILVFPYWPSQPWFPLLLRLKKSDIFIINNGLYIRSQEQGQRLSPTLGAAILCGSHSPGVVCPTKH